MINPLESIRDQVESGLNGFLQGVHNNMDAWFQSAAEAIRTGSSVQLKKMIDLLLTTPTIEHDTIVYNAWSMMRIISFALIGLMFVWQAHKNLHSQIGIGSAVEFKTMFIRFIYGIGLAVFSLDFIDIMIYFNNALVETMRNHFSVYISTALDTSGIFNFLVTLALIAVQIIIAIKLAIQYFMRLGEIWFMAIVSPAIYTLWINPAWSGYLATWFRRIFTTIFTQYIWSLILVLYSNMVTKVVSEGTIWASCMSIAFLLMMHETPTYLRQFMDAQQNPIQIVNGISHKIGGNVITKSLSSRVNGWIRKK